MPERDVKKGYKEPEFGTFHGHKDDKNQNSNQGDSEVYPEKESVDPATNVEIPTKESVEDARNWSEENQQ